MIMLATKAVDPYVPENRWIASLSNGQSIFMDLMPGKPSSWLRLKEYIADNKLSVTQLRLQAYGQLINLISVKDDIEIQGYFFMRKMSRYILIADSPPEIQEMGIGFIKSDKIYITWVREDGIINTEIRSLKLNDIGVILNIK